MKNFLAFTLFVLFFVFISASSTFAEEEKSKQAVPDFSLKNLKGKVAKFTDIKGEGATFITFWATYCKPCIAELPHLQELYEKYKDKGFQVIGINENRAKKLAEVKKLVKQKKITFPTLLDQENKVSKKLGMPSMPYGLLIDGDGNVFEKRVAYQKGDEKDLEAKVVKLLGLEEEKSEKTEEDN